MPTPPPNVLLVIADTVRADHLGLYGYHKHTSKLLSQTVAESPGWTLFNRCYSTAGWTLPACASIITGQLPERHGLVDHSRRFTTQKLAGALQGTHRTAGIGNNGNLVSDDISIDQLDALGLKRRPKKWNHFGWNEGFDTYEWFPHDQHLEAFAAAQKQVDAFAVSPEPWFFMFHTNLAHDYNLDRPYYRATKPFLGAEVDDRLVDFRDGPEVYNELAGAIPNLAEQIVAKYDSGLRRLDKLLADLIDRIDLRNTIVVIVSDHGEGFEPELGRVHHCGRLHQDLLHVPLIMHTPEAVSANVPRAVNHARSVTDIVPTILRMVDGSTTATLDGSDLFGPEKHRTIYASDSAYMYRPHETPIRRLSSDQGPLSVQSVINFPLKSTTYLWEPDGLATHQANLVYDPGELEQTSDPTPDIASQLAAVTVVVDFDEFAFNLAYSPDVMSGALSLEVIDNRGNEAGDAIGPLYAEADVSRTDGRVVYVHPDVYLPEGWVAQTSAALDELDRIDPRWAVAGIAGRVHGSFDRGETGIGHWADPHGYRAFGELPHEVDVVDELIIITRDRTIEFDRAHRGFHCYGTDICAAAQSAGRSVWVIDAFAWHKMRKSNRELVTHSDRSAKITNREGAGFSDEFLLSAEWVRDKWAGKQVLSGMTNYWRDFYGVG